MYSSKTYRSPYPCYSPCSPFNGGANQVPAVATTAGATTAALRETLSDNALYLLGLISLLKDLLGPQALHETILNIRAETTNRPNSPQDQSDKLQTKILNP